MNQKSKNQNFYCIKLKVLQLLLLSYYVITTHRTRRNDSVTETANRWSVTNNRLHEIRVDDGGGGTTSGSRYEKRRVDLPTCLPACSLLTTTTIAATIKAAAVAYNINIMTMVIILI